MPQLFTQASIDFLNKASRQKKPEWLDRNRDEYQEVLVEPMKALMETVAKNLRSESPGYRFPTRNFARIKRTGSWETGSAVFRNWFHVSVSRGSESRFDSLPNLYFHFSDNDFYSAGGLYVPNADQTKHIRSWIAHDPSALEELLEDREFRKCYKELGTERMLKIKPRDYPVDHPKFDWLKLSGWYVWRPLTKKIALSKHLAETLTEDWRQVLRLNRILDRYTTSWPSARTDSHALDLLPEVKIPRGDWD